MTQSYTPHPYLCSELVSIARKGAPHSQIVCGNLEAIGERSAMVLTDVPFRRGTEISIVASSHTLRGNVAQCRREGPLGCYIEVRLKSESRWTEEWFRPEHLLAVGTAKPAKRASKRFTLGIASVAEKFLRADFFPEWKVLPCRSRCH